MFYYKTVYGKPQKRGVYNGKNINTKNSYGEN